MLRRALIVLCAAAPLSAPLSAQFVNRATWLGLDEEGVRRDFRQDQDYFLDRFAYVVAPPWWDRGLLRFGNGARYALGSVTTSKFTVEGQVDHAAPLGSGFAFGYHLLQSEHRDARFLRNAIEFEYEVGPETALFAQGELFADKQWIDASGGVWLWRRGDQALRAMVTVVDAPADKSRDFVYERAPYAVMLAGAFGDPRSHRIVFELGAQLPFEVRATGSPETFAMQRWIGTVESHLVLGGRDRLVLAAEREWTDKDVDSDVPGGALVEDFRRDFRQLRAEWWRDGLTPWSVGVLHTHHGERGLRPNDPAASLRGRHDSWFALVRLQWAVAEPLSFEPQLFAGVVQDRWFDAADLRDRELFQGRLSWNTRFDFSPRSTLVLAVGVQLDELAFGGGGAQFVTRF
ncbi:MAG: hypothetical protein JNM25_14935 [Planctomycetes bacterium]|nr:hypothetical protein [Planctomycetota bacterium]